MKETLYEFEMILIGKKNNYSQYLFNEDAEKKALDIIRFAFDNYLRWGDKIVAEKVNWRIFLIFKIDTLLKYINMPPNLENEDYVKIILSKLYPDIVKINNDEYTIKSFKNSITQNIYKIPNNYLSKTSEGKRRAIVCLQYVIKDSLDGYSVKDLYRTFTMTKCKNLLKKYCLNTTCNTLFDYPIDYLYAAMPHDEENEFWYRYYKLQLPHYKKTLALTDIEK